jgi:ABC-type phosphate/phosphonate transport system substrate-binding protein
MQRNESLTRLRNLVISLAVFVTLAFFASSYAEPVLRVSVMPDESPPLLRRKLMPLTNYLEKKIGMKMEFRPMLDGDALVQALVNGVRLASAQTRSNGQVVPLVQRAGDETLPVHDDHAWAVLMDMDAKLRQGLTNAFLSLNRNNGTDRNILDLQGAHRFIPAEPPVRPGRPGP